MSRILQFVDQAPCFKVDYMQFSVTYLWKKAKLKFLNQLHKMSFVYEVVFTYLQHHENENSSDLKLEFESPASPFILTCGFNCGAHVLKT